MKTNSAAALLVLVVAVAACQSATPAGQVETQIAATVSAGQTSTAAVEQAVALTLPATVPSPTNTLPPSPTVAFIGQIGGSTDAVAVQGNYAYVTDVDGGLRVVDVSDPAYPTEVSFYATRGYVSGVAVAGNYAYVADEPRLRHVADWPGGLQVLDVSDPSHPTMVYLSVMPGGANGVAVAGNYAYVVAVPGLRVLDVSDPSHATEVGSYDPTYATVGISYDPHQQVEDVAVAGNYAYVAVLHYATLVDVDGSLRVLDVSDPSHPTEVGFYATLVGVEDVAVAGNYAYVMDVHGDLRVVDVSDPSHPTEVGFYANLGGASGLAVAGNYAYVVANSPGGLRVLDVSDPSHPTEVGFYDTPGWALGVAVSGTTVYVADGSAGLLILRFLGY